MKKIDLHIHSNYSEDADLSVQEIFSAAQDSNISVISITDHDSIDSIDASTKIAQNYPISYIPGVEITAVFPVDNSQQHIIGYFIDNRSPTIIDALGKIKKYREEICNERNKALKNLGFSLDENKIIEMTGGRPPTAVSTMKEVLQNENNKHDKRLYDYLYGKKKESQLANFYFDFFTEGKPAYVLFKSISVEESIGIILNSKGIPVIAHPKFLKNREWLNILKDMGIRGLEAISTYHNKEDIDFYIEYAKKNDLLITAGSDFHGPTAKPKIMLGNQSGMDYKYYEELIESHKRP